MNATMMQGPSGLNREFLIVTVKAEMARHRWDTFVDDGMVVPGCTLCEVRLNTVSQFVEHLTERVEAAIRAATVNDSGQPLRRRSVQKSASGRLAITAQ